MPTANVISFAAFVISLSSFGFAVVTAWREGRRRRREATLHAYMSTIDRREQYKTLLPSDRREEIIRRRIEESQTDDAVDRAIRDYMNFHEMVATGVNMGVLDIAVISRFGGDSLVHAWNHYLPWIMRQRTELETPSLSCEFEKLAADVAKRRKLECLTAADPELNDPSAPRSSLDDTAPVASTPIMSAYVASVLTTDGLVSITATRYSQSRNLA